MQLVRERNDAAGERGQNATSGFVLDFGQQSYIAQIILILADAILFSAQLVFIQFINLSGSRIKDFVRVIAPDAYNLQNLDSSPSQLIKNEIADSQHSVSPHNHTLLRLMS